jgi:hypothetical protein
MRPMRKGTSHTIRVPIFPLTPTISTLTPLALRMQETGATQTPLGLGMKERMAVALRMQETGATQTPLGRRMQHRMAAERKRKLYEL